MTLNWDVVLDLLSRSTMVLAMTLIAAGVCRRFLLVRQAILQIGLVTLMLLPLALPIPKLNWSVLPPLSHPESPATPLVTTVTPAPAQMIAHMPSEASRVRPDLHEKIGSATSITRKAATTDSITPRPDRLRPVADVKSGSRFISVYLWSLIYATGVLLMWVRLGLGLRQIRALQRSSAVHADECWLNVLRQCCQRLGITVPVSLRSTSMLTTPLTYGCWRPVLMIPVSVLECATPAERRAIVLHELTHIQRHDFAWVIALHVLQSVYWFHPLAWWFARVFGATQEEVCDAICVAEFGTQQYSEALVNVARSLQRPSTLTLGLAMSRASRLSQRLTRIQLHGGLPMSRLSRRSLCALLVVALPVGVASLLVQPARAQPVIEAARAAEQTTTQPEVPIARAASPQAGLPRVVLQLQTEDKQPLKSTAVTVRRYREVKGAYELDSQGMELTTDSSGVITVPVADAQPGDEDVGLEINVTGRAPQMEGFYIVRTTEQPKPKVVRLLPGTTLTTHIFDADGHPVSDARVTLIADIDPEGHQVWEMLRVSDAEGRIELCVPRDTVFGFTVVSNRGAPYRIVCPAGTQQLSEIHLPRGCTVAGQLLDRTGKPVPNCSVTLEGEDSEAVSTEYDVKRHGGGSLDLEFRRKTDGDGRFRFPPMVGHVRVYLGDNAATKPSRMVIPVSLELPHTGEKWLPLMVAPTGQVTGTVRWPDGKPVANLTLELLVPTDLSLSDITLHSTRTDAQGRYTLDVPFPLETALITGLGTKGPDGKYWEVRPAASQAGERQWQPINRYLGAPLTIDWVMVRHEEPRSTETVAVHEVGLEWQPLAKLEQEIAAAQQAYRQAPEGEAREKLDPRRTMVDRCLAFEAEHRGTRLAIGALQYVMQAAASTTDRHVNDARTKAVTVLDQHYLKHPDVDLLIGHFNAGSGTPNAEPLLLHLAEQSPFDYVRAAALFELAENHFDLLHLAEHIHNTPLPSEADHEALVKIQPSESSREWLRNQRVEALRFREIIKNIDVKELRQSAIALLDRIVNNYSNVKSPRRRWENTAGKQGVYELKLVDSNETWRIRTIPERAEILRFQQTSLQVGMPAAEIEGLDFHQRPIRLSQFKGQVVLLAVGVGNSDKELCAKCGQVVTALQGQPFQCISVVSGSGGWSVRDIVEEGKITWPIIRDTSDDDITSRWCQQTSPEIYILDQQGIIRQHHLGDYISADGIEQHVRSLLKAPTP